MNMRNAVFGGQHGKFFTNEEYELLCNKILANNELIKQLKEEVGIDDQ